MNPPSLSRFLRRVANRIMPARTDMRPATSLPEGLCSIKSIDPADIVICGYPKSGNTWAQVLVAGAIYGVSPFHAPNSLVQDLVPDLHTTVFYRRYQTPMFFKSHGLPRPEYRRVIYLLRDGRDVMVSYMHHQRAILGTAVSMSDTIEMAANAFHGTWHAHVESWRGNPFSADMITIKYEDLLDDPVRELSRLCEFAGVVRSNEYLTHVARESRFDRMQEREQLLGWNSQIWPKNTPFVRRGVAGAYRDEFPNGCLTHFIAEAGPILRDCGYSLE
jgi:hypothetical protein